MENLEKFYINGSWVIPNSTETMPVLNPATEQKIGRITLGNGTDEDQAVTAAKAAFEDFSQTSKAQRLSLLIRLKAITEARFEDLAQAMRLEMGAPISMARSDQADAAVGHLQGFIDALKELEEQITLTSGLITPWNWPMNQIVLKVVPALATGSCCILKPSEHTPISAMIYAEIIDEAGYPPGVFNLVNGDGPTVGAALSRHADIQMMSFTGSTRAGIAVTQDAAPTVKRVTLELGGKSPNLVFADCELETQITASVQECMFNSGQSCDAPTRLLVERACYDEALDIAKRAGEATLVDSPEKEGDHIGPLFDKIQFDRVQAMISTGIDEGATLLVGGLGRPDGMEAGWYVKPTIFADVSNDMRIAQEEIFGPVLVIIPFESEQEAVAIANDTPYGLASYLQTGNPERARRVAAQLRAGSVHINGGGINYGTPFGGYKQSGNGREGGMMGLEDYLETKTLHGLT